MASGTETVGSTLQSLPPAFEPPTQSRLAQACRFSLHAGIGIGGGELEKLERLCRYISRPAPASERLALTAGGGIRYTLKSPYRDGTTHVLFEPLDFLARLAALVPLPAAASACPRPPSSPARVNDSIAASSCPVAPYRTPRFP